MGLWRAAPRESHAVRAGRATGAETELVCASNAALRGDARKADSLRLEASARGPARRRGRSPTAATPWGRNALGSQRSGVATPRGHNALTAGRAPGAQAEGARDAEARARAAAEERLAGARADVADARALAEAGGARAQALEEELVAVQEQAAQAEGDLRAQLVAEVLGRAADVAALNQALTDVREAARASVERVFAQRKAHRLLLLAARSRSALYVHDPGFETLVANEVAALKGASADEVFALTEQYTRGGRDRDDDVATPLDAPAASPDRQFAALKSPAGTPPPPPPPRTNRTRRVPHPVLIGHAIHQRR